MGLRGDDGKACCLFLCLFPEPNSAKLLRWYEAEAAVGSYTTAELAQKISFFEGKSNLNATVIWKKVSMLQRDCPEDTGEVLKVITFAFLYY